CALARSNRCRRARSPVRANSTRGRLRDGAPGNIGPAARVLATGWARWVERPLSLNDPCHFEHSEAIFIHGYWEIVSVQSSPFASVPPDQVKAADILAVLI